MKKTFFPILFVLALFSFGCSNQDSSLLQKYNLTESYQKCLSQIKKEEECLNSAVFEKIYYGLDDKNKINTDICDATLNLEAKQNCILALAMREKDISICEYLPQTTEESAAHVWDYPADTYATRDYCKEIMHYEYQDAKWDFEAHSPVLYLSFKGSAVFNGWLVEEDFYDKKITLFHVRDEDMQKLPRDYYIKNTTNFELVLSDESSKFLFGYKEVPEDFMKQLAKATEQNPATIKINRVAFRNEAPRQFYLSEENFELEF